MNTLNSGSAFSFRPLRLPLARRQAVTHGFTLVELAMSLAVLSVLVTFAVPTFTAMMVSSKLTAASNALLSSMHLARSEAIKRRSRVVLCKSANGAACNAAGGWEQGWIVFHDSNNNGDRDPGESVIARIEPLPGSMRVNGNAPVAKYVSFVSTGATKLLGGAFQAGTLTVCDQTASTGEARVIVLNAVGRPRIQKVSASECA